MYKFIPLFILVLSGSILPVAAQESASETVTVPVMLDSEQGMIRSDLNKLNSQIKDLQIVRTEGNVFFQQSSGGYYAFPTVSGPIEGTSEIDTYQFTYFSISDDASALNRTEIQTFSLENLTASEKLEFIGLVEQMKSTEVGSILSEELKERFLNLLGKIIVVKPKKPKKPKSPTIIPETPSPLRCKDGKELPQFCKEPESKIFPECQCAS